MPHLKKIKQSETGGNKMTSSPTLERRDLSSVVHMQEEEITKEKEKTTEGFTELEASVELIIQNKLEGILLAIQNYNTCYWWNKSSYLDVISEQINEFLKNKSFKIEDKTSLEFKKIQVLASKILKEMDHLIMYDERFKNELSSVFYTFTDQLCIHLDASMDIYTLSNFLHLDMKNSFETTLLHLKQEDGLNISNFSLIPMTHLKNNLETQSEVNSFLERIKSILSEEDFEKKFFLDLSDLMQMRLNTTILFLNYSAALYQGYELTPQIMNNLREIRESLNLKIREFPADESMPLDISNYYNQIRYHLDRMKALNLFAKDFFTQPVKAEKLRVYLPLIEKFRSILTKQDEGVENLIRIGMDKGIYFYALNEGEEKYKLIIACSMEDRTLPSLAHFDPFASYDRSLTSLANQQVVESTRTALEAITTYLDRKCKDEEYKDIKKWDIEFIGFGYNGSVADLAAYKLAKQSINISEQDTKRKISSFTVGAPPNLDVETTADAKDVLSSRINLFLTKDWYLKKGFFSNLFTNYSDYGIDTFLVPERIFFMSDRTGHKIYNYLPNVQKAIATPVYVFDVHQEEKSIIDAHQSKMREQQPFCLADLKAAIGQQTIEEEEL